MGCGGLCAAPAEDENFDEILENQEPRLCGGVPAGGVFLSAESVLVKPGRVGVIGFGEFATVAEGSVGGTVVGVVTSGTPPLAPFAGGEPGAGLGVAGSRS